MIASNHSLLSVPFGIELACWWPQILLAVYSSAWLEAVPHPSLGLAMPVAKFVVAVCIWLGVSLFPIEQLCTCASSIDPNDDHLLGCPYGPFRIRRHDGLASILFHSCSWTILVFSVNRESLSLDLVIFTILTSVKAIRLSLMFLFEIHSLRQLFLRRQFLLGLLLLLGRFSAGGLL